MSTSDRGRGDEFTTQYASRDLQLRASSRAQINSCGTQILPWQKNGSHAEQLRGTRFGITTVTLFGVAGKGYWLSVSAKVN